MENRGVMNLNIICNIKVNYYRLYRTVTVTKNHRDGLKKREFQSILKLAQTTKKGTPNDRRSCPYQYNQKVEGVTTEIEEKVLATGMEESAHTLGLLVGREVFQGVIEAQDERLANKKPAGWRNMGTEKRRMVSSLGTMGCKIRVYLDRQEKQIKSLDERLG